MAACFGPGLSEVPTKFLTLVNIFSAALEIKRGFVVIRLIKMCLQWGDNEGEYSGEGLMAFSVASIVGGVARQQK